MFSLFYRFIVSPLAFLVLLPILQAVKIGSPKFRKTLSLRIDETWKTKSLKNPVWFHCASGEYEYAKPIIRALKEFRPDLEILVTYYSPSVENQLKKAKDIDLALPLPRDLFFEMAQFIQKQNPKCLLISRTDTWPELVFQSRQLGVPNLLFSATLSEQSTRGRGLSRLLYSEVFNQINDIYCVSEADHRSFLGMGVKTNIEVCGDSRFDQVLHRVENGNPIKDSLFKNIDNSIIVAGSTWKEDESVLVNSKFLTQNPVSWVIAPHEPSEDHLDHLEAELAKSGYKSDRYTDIESWDGESVLIIDCVGILADIYKFADFAFVGGSFKKTVHSVMEPLACGCITFVGPYHENNREALEFRALPVANSRDLNVVNSFTSPSVLAQNLDTWSGQDLAPYKQAIKNEVISKSGASQSVLNWIAKVIE